jgi:hypothetical protein
MPNKTTTSTEGNASHHGSRSFSSFCAVDAKYREFLVLASGGCALSDDIPATSAAQHQGRSEQMQRWLDTPRRHEPYVAGNGIAKDSAEMHAEIDQALRILQKGSRDGKH